MFNYVIWTVSLHSNLAKGRYMLLAFGIPVEMQNIKLRAEVLMCGSEE
jgi:hypothetical protein